MPFYPYGDGGSAITSRKVQWKEASGSWDNDADVSEEVVLGHCWVCRYTITGLTNGVAYTVRVFVTNAIGDSPPSDELTSTPTDGTALTLSGITRTNYPEDESLPVAVYPVTGAQGEITWSLSGDDGDEFSISTGGHLRFKSLPSFENPTDADGDNQYRVTVQASDGTNTATLQVVVVVNSRGRPIINGNAQVGQMLTADTSGITDADGLYNPNFTYQWIANDGNTDSEIAGATASTYTLTDSEEGKTIKVRVSFTDYFGYPGNEESLTSAATAAVQPEANFPATGVPTISGTAQMGETLTASTSGITDADGLSNVAYRYQWLSSRDTEIDGATDSTYTLAEAVPRQLNMPNYRRLVLPVHLLYLAPLLGGVGAVAGHGKLQYHGVVHHPVDGRGGGHGVGEAALPLREDQVGRDAQRPPFVAFGDEGEEDLRLLGALGQVAQIVQEQEVEVVQPPQPARQVEVALGGQQILHQAVGWGEEDGAAGFHQAVAQGAERVGLAGAGKSEGQHVDAAIYEAALGQVIQLLSERQGHPVVLEGLSTKLPWAR